MLELNTGLFYLKNNLLTKRFLLVMFQGIFLHLWKRRDQMFYNTFIYHRHFSEMNWCELSEERYIPGVRLHRNNLAERPITTRPVAIHLSDTESYRSKIVRAKAIGHWYFQPTDVCLHPVNLCEKIPTCWFSLNVSKPTELLSTL